MPNPFDSVGNMFKIQARAVVGVVIGIIAGIVLGFTVDWKIGVISGVVIVGLSIVYAVVAGAKAAKSVFTVVADAAQEVFTEVQRDFNEPDLKGRHYGALPPHPVLPPDIAQRFGVPQHPSPRDFFAQQRQRDESGDKE